MQAKSRIGVGLFWAGLAALLWIGLCQGEEKTTFGDAVTDIGRRSDPQAGTLLESRVESIGLFKNGLAVVKRRIELPGAGKFEITDIPDPVHGTLWVESEAEIEIRTTTRMTEVPLEARRGVELEADLTGKTVTVHFRGGDLPMTQGRVIGRSTVGGGSGWSRDYEQSRDYGRVMWWGSANSSGVLPNGGAGREFLILETDTGQVFLDPAMIAFLRVQGEVETVKRRQPVLQLTAREAAKAGPVIVEITYLTKGMAWAPSYRVDLSDTSTLAIRQKAVIRNELMDLDDVEIELISGFPNVEFGHVLSPLSPRTNWSDFFGRLSRRMDGGADVMSNRVTQQMVSYRDFSGVDTGIDLDAITAGSGVDLHYASVGRHSLAEGDALMLPTASGSAAYERIVEWEIADTRDGYGRLLGDYQYSRYGEAVEEAEEIWDAVRFRNPFAFPMTTGAATVVSNGRFNGERTSHWVNPGEETTLRITKALSVQAQSSEDNVDAVGEIQMIGSSRYRATTVTGELRLTNLRDEVVKVVVRRAYSGKLIAAEGEPVESAARNGARSINAARELAWTLELAPGERRRVAYSYSLLVLQ